MDALGYGILDEPIVRKVNWAMQHSDKIVTIQIAGEDYRISRPLAEAVYCDDGVMRTSNGGTKSIL